MIALRYPSQVIQKSDPACVLTPHDHNLHEISCMKGPAAFLDILSPPYDVDADGRERSLRPCTFFRQIGEEKTNDGPEDTPVKVRLMAGYQPPVFYSTNLKYLGPPLRWLTSGDAEWRSFLKIVSSVLKNDRHWAFFTVLPPSS